MKERKRASVSVAQDTKNLLDAIKRPGQSYDGVIRELVMHWEKKKSEKAVK